MPEDIDMDDPDKTKNTTFKKALMKRYLDNSCDSTRGDPRDQEIVTEALLHSPENIDREAKTLLQNILQQSPQRLPYTIASMYAAHATGSLPPSPADSGVSDVDSSSSHLSNEETKPRLIGASVAASRTPESPSPNGMSYATPYGPANQPQMYNNRLQQNPHRYIFLIYEQPRKLKDHFEDWKRTNFNLKKFVQDRELKGPVAGNFFLLKD